MILDSTMRPGKVLIRQKLFVDADNNWKIMLLKVHSKIKNCKKDLTAKASQERSTMVL